MRSVVLEILRHGPPHNQLLSPLTRYLALCGNHAAETVTVPYEHHQFLAIHESLAYELEGSPENRTPTIAQERQREMQLHITADEMAKFLATMPGLISELKLSNCRHGDTQTPEFTHFELVLSASELALLPFELANSPNGFPGAGQPLSLQSQAPLSITRRVRRVNATSAKWFSSSCPQRILFAWHLPLAHQHLVPAHLLALRRAVDPWVGRDATEGLDPDRSPRKLAELLTVLPNASENQIEAELARQRYSHVHLLAHGDVFFEGADKRYGLVLAHPTDGMSSQIVSASRLASMIRTLRDTADPDLALPTTVTLASCNSGGVGTVFGAGASIAHALHEAGVPLVVASQFPLSFHASVLMVDRLYHGLLWGDDPRVVLLDLRRRMKTQLPTTHDWASLVAYAAFPSDVDDQLDEMQFERALNGIFATFSLSDRYQNEVWKHHLQSENRQGDIGDSVVQLRHQFDDRIKEPRRRLENLDRRWRRNGRRSRHRDEQIARVHGRLASTAKRLAIGDMFNALYDRAELNLNSNLIDARKHYRIAFDTDRSQTWALVQDIILSFVLLDLESDKPLSEFDAIHAQLGLARNLCERDRGLSDHAMRLWAIAGLIELDLITFGGALMRLPQCSGTTRRQLLTVVQRLEETSKPSVLSPELRTAIDQLVQSVKLLIQPPPTEVLSPAALGTGLESQANALVERNRTAAAEAKELARRLDMPSELRGSLEELGKLLDPEGTLNDVESTRQDLRSLVEEFRRTISASEDKDRSWEVYSLDQQLARYNWWFYPYFRHPLREFGSWMAKEATVVREQLAPEVALDHA